MVKLHKNKVLFVSDQYLTSCNEKGAVARSSAAAPINFDEKYVKIRKTKEKQLEKGSKIKPN